MKRRTFLQLGLLALAGCTAPPAATALPDSFFEGTPTPIPTRAAIPPEECHPAALIAPTKSPPPRNVDSVDDLGLHVVNSGAAVTLDPLSYRLWVTGKVDHPLELTLDELRCMPKMTRKVNLTCAGYFEDVTTYAGVPLKHILQLAQLQDGIKGFNLLAGDGYEGFVTLQQALQGDNYLAYQWKDEPLPIFHGFPLRAVFPSMLGYAWTKYLVEISAI